MFHQMVSAIRKISNTKHSIHYIKKHIPHQQERDSLLKNFITKVLHTYNLTIHAAELAKEYNHSPRLKDIYPYIRGNQLPTSVPAKMRIETDSLKYFMINKLLF